VNTDPKQTNDSPVRPTRRKSRALPYAMVTVLAFTAAGVGVWAVWGPDGGTQKIAPGDIHVVERGPLTISIREAGTIHHRDKVIVKSKLEGQSTVIWIIDEGKHVRKGALLLEMDASGFEQKKEQQDIVVINSEANLISAREALKVTENDAKTAIDDAKLAIELAKLDLKKYVGSAYYEHLYKEIERQLAAEAEASAASDDAAATRPAAAKPAEGAKARPTAPATMPTEDAGRAVELAEEELKRYVGGEYHQQLKEMLAQIEIVKEELKRAEERVTWSKKLYEQKYMTLTELQADELAARRAALDLSTAKSKLFVLLRYTHAKNLAELRNSLVKVMRALEPVQRKAAADIREAEARLKARESEHKQQLLLLDKAEQQIKECKVHSPVAGEVVYATTTSSHWRHQNESLEEGSTVRERQELFHMPGEDKKMMTVIKIPQASRSKVCENGSTVRPLAARITIAEAKDTFFPGTLAKMAPMPDNIPWYRGDQSVKVFTTEIYLNDVHEELRPGFRCDVEIIVAQYDNVLSVPLYAVTQVRGQPTVYVRNRRTGDFVPRPVELGLDNNRMVHVISGLSEGDEVLLAPPLDEAKSDAEPPAGRKGAAPAAASGPARTDKPADTGKPADNKRPDFRSMTPEQRRKMFESMTPEQKEALRKRMRQGGGRSGEPGRGKPERGGSDRGAPGGSRRDADKPSPTGGRPRQ